MAFTTNFGSGDYEDVLQNYSKTALQQAESISNRPFESYGGERVAGFTDEELAGRARAAQLAGSGLGYDELQQAMGVASDLTGFTYADPAAIQARINPFLQGALDPALRQIREQQEQTLQGVGAGAARAGAFGGSRQGVLEAETLKGFGQQQADLIGTGYAQAFDRATTLMGDEAARRLAAAGALSSGANQMRSMEYSDADVLRALGAEERAMDQARLEVPYQDFLRQQAFPTQQLQARLAPLGFGAQVATAAPTIEDPSFLQKSLGTVGYLANIAGGLGKAGIIGGGGSNALFEF